MSENEIIDAHDIRWFRIAGTFFVFVQLVIFSSLLFDPATRPFLLWVCNHFSILLAYACFTRNMQLIKGVSYTGLIAQLLWIFDFTAHGAGFNPLGISDYIAREGFTYANEVSVGLHMCIPLMVLALGLRTKPLPRSLGYAALYVVFVYAVTLLFTPRIEDINCVFLGCGLSQYVPYHVVLWPLYALGASIGGYAIHYGLYYAWQEITAYRHASDPADLAL